MFLHSGHYSANEGPFWLAALSFLGLGRVGRDRGQRRRRERGIKSGPPFSLSLLFWRSPQRPPYHFSSRWKFGPPPKKNTMGKIEESKIHLSFATKTKCIFCQPSSSTLVDWHSPMAGMKTRHRWIRCHLPRPTSLPVPLLVVWWTSVFVLPASRSSLFSDTIHIVDPPPPPPRHPAGTASTFQTWSYL